MTINGESKTKTRIKIVIVGMVNSIHIVRWVSQIEDQNWEIYLFPVEWVQPHAEYRNISIFANKFFRPASLDKSVRYIRWSSLSFYLDIFKSWLTHKSSKKFRVRALLRVIQTVKPDIVHSLEMQHAGYLTLAVREKMKGNFPKWAMTIWGSDIYLFGRLQEHKARIRSVLEVCDFFGCEGERDINLARELGLKGKTLPILPATGGFNLDYCRKLRQSGVTSDRQTIVLKGYQNFAGRALVGLRALTLCADILTGYRVSIFGASADVLLAAELFSQDTHIPVDIVSGNAYYAQEDEILQAFGKARIAVGLSISDGLPRSLLEAMVMGAYPIQSDSACVDGWIEDGKNGTLVPSEDPEAIARAIRVALTDNILINNAAEINFRIASE